MPFIVLGGTFLIGGLLGVWLFSGHEGFEVSVRLAWVVVVLGAVGIVGGIADAMKGKR